MSLYGGIEAGGTKWVCAVGTGPDDLRDTVTFATTTPEETIGRAAGFFAAHDGALAAVGVGSFGPIDVARGTITTTPKAGWAGVGVVAALGAALGRPVAFDTDVNAAALGEQRWGAAVGLDTFCYVTVGTGIGGGAVVGGRLLHGLVHPELGHMRIPHDRAADPFAGACPFHGDCFEGLASGEAIRQRWGRPGDQLRDDAVWRLEADYLALGLVNVISTLSPQRIIVGGGVMKTPGLLELVRTRVEELVGGYVESAEIVAPGLGDRAGVLGALELARTA
jgi:fructokinase